MNDRDSFSAQGAARKGRHRGRPLRIRHPFPKGLSLWGRSVGGLRALRLRLSATSPSIEKLHGLSASLHTWRLLVRVQAIGDRTKRRRRHLVPQAPKLHVRKPLPQVLVGGLQALVRLYILLLSKIATRFFASISFPPSSALTRLRSRWISWRAAISSSDAAGWADAARFGFGFAPPLAVAACSREVWRGARLHP